MNQVRQQGPQLQVDNHIHRLKVEHPSISFQELANIINTRFGTCYSAREMMLQWDSIEKPSKETIAAIFQEFQRFETDFGSISQRTGISLGRVRKEIVSGLANNIFKVCMIVRKRSISKLSRNLISQRNIKNLVMLILKPNNFRKVKEEYAVLWNFISRNHEEGYYRTVSDENYKLIYSDLIILAEFYKVNDALEDQPADLGFQRNILRQSNDHSLSNTPLSDPFALLNQFRGKKQLQLTIDLVSEEEQEEKEQARQEEKQVEENGEGVLQKGQQTILQRSELFGQLVDLYGQMSQLQHTQKTGNQNVRQKMASVALRICTIEYLIGWN